MIRLTRHEEGGVHVLKIDGSLGVDTIDELRRVLEDERVAPLTLDLDGLCSLDVEGRSLLLRLRREGHRLRGGSLYIRQLFEETQG